MLTQASRDGPRGFSERLLRWPQPLTRKFMIDNLKEFISEALCQPSDYVTYFASVKLAEMYPGAAIIESESWALNLPEYAEAGLCSVWGHEAVHCQSKTYWRGVGDGLEREIENGWFSVLWPD